MSPLDLSNFPTVEFFADSDRRKLRPARQEAKGRKAKAKNKRKAARRARKRCTA